MGEKRYELSNHLGNVLAVITDRRFAIEDAGATGNVKYYEPDVIAAQDYHPFGMLLTGRSWEAGNDYRYTFNGKENDNEIYGDAASLDFGFRIYNCIIGRWLSLDPLAIKHPGLSPYSSFNNNPILFVDPDGRDFYISGDTKQAQDDILNMLSPANRDFVSFKETSEGSGIFLVSFNLAGGAINGDAGSLLLQSLDEAAENYMYRVDDIAVYLTRSLVQGEEVTAPQGYNLLEAGLSETTGEAVGAYGVSNISETERNIYKSIAEEGNLRHKSRFTPIDVGGLDINGQVTLAVLGVWKSADRSIKSRSEILFHELWENYERTTNGLPYQFPGYDTGGKKNSELDPTRAGAHQMSIDAQTGEGSFGGYIYHENKNKPEKAKFAGKSGFYPKERYPLPTE